MKVVPQAVQKIAEARRPVAMCHVSPDGDAIGSLLGLGLALTPIKDRVTLCCTDPVPTECKHLPHWEMITAPPVEGDVDLVISLDCTEVGRLGKAYDVEALGRVPIVNIDHHATNVGFGDVNWVEPQAAATAQMLVCLIEALRIPPSREVATCLLNGILTDTLGFRTANTNVEVMDAAVKLMKAGASLSELTDSIFNHRPLSTIRLWALALQSLCLEGRVVWSEITRDIRGRVGYQEDGDAGLVNFLNTAGEADMSVVFDELPDGRISVSIRAAPGYDVSRVAFELGGGGHAQAAGCTLSGRLADVRTQVLSRLHQAWDVQTLSR
jgi:phosphoesterase RecJ-like protein